MKNCWFVISGLIMVATGSQSDKCQVVDVSSSMSCANLPTYPFEMYGAAGGVINNSPTICGGFSTTSGSHGAQESCYTFNKDINKWKFHCNMTSRRVDYAATVMKDALFISGGFHSNSTEFIHANGTVTSGPDLPVARFGHCMVTLHDGKVMIIGAATTSSLHHKNVSTFDSADNSFTPGPSLSYKRIHAACTIFKSNLHNGRPVVLAAGGSGTKTAEVYDYTNNNQWQTSIHLNISNM